MPEYNVFLSGPGGVGKSHVIKLIHYETMKLLKPLFRHFEPDELPVLLTAFTGTAAFGIEGMTLHSSLGFSCGPKNQKQYQPAGSEKLNTLRSRLSKLKLLIIDEVSMVVADLLYHVHRRLQDICALTRNPLLEGSAFWPLGIYTSCSLLAKITSSASHRTATPASMDPCGRKISG